MGMQIARVVALLSAAAAPALCLLDPPEPAPFPFGRWVPYGSPHGGRSRVRVTLNNHSHFYCDTDDPTPFELWLSVTELAPLVFNCFMDNMKLVWDDVKKTNMDRKVYVKTVDYGTPPGTGSQIDPPSRDGLPWNKGKNPHVFDAVRDALVKNLGYSAQNQMTVIPYDWRLGPYQFLAAGGDYDQCKDHIEQRYAAHGNRSVMALSMSMGGPWFHLFLKMQTQAWKDKHIAGWASLGGAFGGATEILHVLLSGEKVYNVPYFDPLQFQDATASWGSMVMLGPSPTGNATFDASPMVRGPDRNYNFSEVRAALTAAVASGRDSAKKSLQVHDVNDHLTIAPPGVDVWCLYSYNTKTQVRLTYKKADLSDSDPVVEMGDGDGTVHYESLAVCDQWAKSDPKHKLEVHRYNGVGHVPMLANAGVIKDVVAVATALKKN